jgi:hypothetical protein
MMVGGAVVLLLVVSAYWFQKPRGSQDLHSKTEEKEMRKAEQPAQSPVPVAHNKVPPVKKERAPQAVEPGKEEFKTLEDLQRAYGSGWNAITGEVNGRRGVRSILVAEATSPVLSQDNVLDFIQKVRPVFGAPGAELALKNTERPHQYDFEQTLKGYEVYGGRVRVITDPENATPVIINNDLKPIEVFNDNIVFTANAAEEVIQKNVLDPVQAMTLVVQEKPMAFHTRGNQGELSWLVHVEWVKDRKMHSKDFLVSAVDGKILFERNLVDH